MPIGINLQLFNGAVMQADLADIQAFWWDVLEPRLAQAGGRPVGRSQIVTSDGEGYINLDLSGVTALAVGDFGFLMLYKLNATDHMDSLSFAGRVQTSEIASGVEMVGVLEMTGDLEMVGDLEMI